MDRPIAAQEITGELAATEHGVWTRHERMPNGELRFRLRKFDGTAYIRTQATATGGWQSSHYHESVKETYIVQRGWIAFAELVDGNRKLTLRRAGDVFTTQPGVIHNVYMPADAVIHTVKHGEADGEDRITNEATKRFDRETQSLDEEEIEREASAQEAVTRADETYTASYRHFDTLIWQVPSWCTAVFAVACAGAGWMQQDGFLQKAAHVSSVYLTTGFLALMAAVILVWSQALYRFRIHQASLKRYRRTPIWSSASTYLQLIVSLEAFALLYVMLLINGFPQHWVAAICLAVPIGWWIFREYRLQQPASRIRQPSAGSSSSTQTQRL